MLQLAAGAEEPAPITYRDNRRNELLIDENEIKYIPFILPERIDIK